MSEASERSNRARWAIMLTIIAFAAIAVRQFIVGDVAALLAWAWVQAMDVVMRLVAALFGG